MEAGGLSGATPASLLSAISAGMQSAGSGPLALPTPIGQTDQQLAKVLEGRRLQFATPAGLTYLLHGHFTMCRPWSETTQTGQEGLKLILGSLKSCSMGDHPCIVMRVGGCAGSGSAPAEVLPGGAAAGVAAEISGLSPLLLAPPAVQVSMPFDVSC